MTKRRRIAVWFAVLVLAATATYAAPPGQTTFTENFENGNNTGGWTFGNPALEILEPTGGNPGAYLHFPFLDTFAPRAGTAHPGSPFTGNYRAQGVFEVGIDLVLFHVDFTSRERPLAVLLHSDAGTRTDLTDDCTVSFLGNKNAPMPNGAWRSYRFRIPAQSAGLPAGWKVLECAGRGAADAWNLVIQDVDEMSFHVGDPELFFIFQVWDIGMDNPTITFGTPSGQ